MYAVLSDVQSELKDVEIEMWCEYSSKDAYDRAPRFSPACQLGSRSYWVIGKSDEVRRTATIRSKVYSFEHV